MAGGLVAVAAVAVSGEPAASTTLHVENNGVDGPGCGAATAPCRSISQAVANARPRRLMPGRR